MCTHFNGDRRREAGRKAAEMKGQSIGRARPCNEINCGNPRKEGEEERPPGVGETIIVHERRGSS